MQMQGNVGGKMESGQLRHDRDYVTNGIPENGAWISGRGSHSLPFHGYRRHFWVKRQWRKYDHPPPSSCSAKHNNT